MAERTLFLDESLAERRGVVTLDGRPERLLIERGDEPAATLGARFVGRVQQVDRARGLAFLELPGGAQALLAATAGAAPPREGAFLDLVIRAEARGGKSALARPLGEAEGPARLLAAAPDLAARLAAFAPGVASRGGEAAREAADRAQAEALARVFPLAGGGEIALETTRALTAIDVDLGGRGGSAAKRVARAANLAAIGLAARLLRLKGLGGLVALDLVGRGHDGPALLAAARAAFAADGPGVALDGPGRFGVLLLTLPRAAAPTLERLAEPGGAPRPATVAADLVRRLEREAALDPSARLAARAAPAVAAAAAAAVARLNARLGGRVAVLAEATMPRDRFAVDQR